MPGLLHVVCARLRPDIDAAVLEQATALACGLRDAEGARASMVARSAEELLTATWLDGREALEPFAASEAHMAFIMRGVAQVTNGVWSAAVEVDAPPPEEAHALWLFALRGGDDVYEWQVQDLLQQIEALPGTAAAGPTFEERDRFRAAGAIAVRAQDTRRFEDAVELMLAEWRERELPLECASAPVVARRGPSA